MIVPTAPVRKITSACDIWTDQIRKGTSVPPQIQATRPRLERKQSSRLNAQLDLYKPGGAVEPLHSFVVDGRIDASLTQKFSAGWT